MTVDLKQELLIALSAFSGVFGFIFLLISLIFFYVDILIAMFFLLLAVCCFAIFYWAYIYHPKNKIRQAKIAKEEEKKRHEEEIRGKYGNLFFSIVESIKAFKPILCDYENELPYHIDLARWLESKYPMLKVEYQLGSARPDIVIEDIAIEIKGPTTEEGLQSIADKCLRYHHHFKKMIIVLFDIRTKTERFYTEWEEGLKRHFPDVMVIKK